jgi:iron complex outermembrane receptor protein
VQEYASLHGLTRHLVINPSGYFSLRNARQIVGVAVLGFIFDATAAYPPVQALDPVTVTATRTAETPYNVPASISVVSGESFQNDSLGVNLSEGVSALPGLLAHNRQDYAQEEQVSIRGFGANSTFGILGVRLYVDDIPATQPDGQGASSNFNFASADRVEVLRGPFSTLYGNSAGGVISIYTADGTDVPAISGGAVAGSYGTYRADLGTGGTHDIADYNLHFTHFHTDGYRDHSNARRESFNGKVNLQLSERSRLSLVSNYLSSPGVQDPMGLTPAMFDADPSQAVAAAYSYNTRKSTQQAQLGAVYEYKLSNAQSFRLLAYYGQRQVMQFLSIPMSSEAPPASPGGVVNLNNTYGGGDARWTYHSSLLDRPISLIAGLSFDKLHEHRQGYNNYLSSTDLGVQGMLRRDEIDTVYNLDQYMEVNWAFAEQWSVLAGVRRSQLDFDSSDLFPVDATHPDTSGSKTYVATTPVGGLLFKAKPWMHWYASYGAGFQTPTIDQLSYRPDAGPGLNFGLKPAHSNNAELGTKLRLGERTQVNVAVFDSLTHNELVVASNANGRSTYQNIGSTRRQGVEAGLETEFARNWKLQLAYTYVDAAVREAYLTCASSGCATPTVPVAAGNRLPGVPLSNAYAAIRWGAETGWHASLNGQYLSDIQANDSNTVAAPSYSLFGVDGGYVFNFSRYRVSTFVRVDNLLDKRYVIAISVNDGNGHFYYPGTSRSALAGFSVDWK